MKCLACRAPIIKVMSTRNEGDDLIRRVRECGCGARWVTAERPDRDSLTLKAPSVSESMVPSDGVPVVHKANTNGETSSISGPPLVEHLAISGPPVDPRARSFRSSSDLDLFSDLGSDQISSKQIRKNYNTMSRSPPRYGPGCLAALARFCELWKGRYGKSYRPMGRDIGRLDTLVAGLEPEDLADLPLAFANFLKDLSPWVAQAHRHSLFCFCESDGFNKYRTVAPILTKREAMTVAAGEQWLAMQEGGHGENGSK